ncbi:hypothetical protein BASA50_009923 [Batrachochytrium salamandrivorans]|uniref:Uncharacterized protein n=1 Tax=Batrachochytrium salamandrivorans TaxID=1357716 RepID=A0ABQ8F122_9FUNG|nr:hypothetical protein BASA60_005590 [Batrachochytrium salamandrivorans]KAH6577324.1 hypothetical protein BASA62_000962 [Batrachochytrium salamandrivorans]KAH6589611.1 hypothetical protein BASA50_009923 [Batrachochytrium salamandrivorans]KAH6591566.1 hypothetical protein BASA61_004882 [Batrachochytrium salamandrivorans]KAH9268990.1 hypothetical protein BASA83_008992 [Batrachochytrium salamandrivorans]
MTYTIACADSIFDIFETPALEEDEDIDIFATATSFDEALFDIFDNPALDEHEDEDVIVLTPVTPSSETMISVLRYFLYDCAMIMMMLTAHVFTLILSFQDLSPNVFELLIHDYYCGSSKTLSDMFWQDRIRVKTR